jgi:hypothetical protein
MSYKTIVMNFDKYIWRNKNSSYWIWELTAKREMAGRRPWWCSDGRRWIHLQRFYEALNGRTVWSSSRRTSQFRQCLLLSRRAATDGRMEVFNSDETTATNHGRSVDLRISGGLQLRRNFGHKSRALRWSTNYKNRWQCVVLQQEHDETERRG